MNRAFVYGTSVEGENFTDRVKETKRLKMDFENGINEILISPRPISPRPIRINLAFIPLRNGITVLS
jgi:hypothetical protein